MVTKLETTLETSLQTVDAEQCPTLRVQVPYEQIFAFNFNDRNSLEERLNSKFT
jgi:hypothetical protein